VEEHGYESGGNLCKFVLDGLKIGFRWLTGVFCNIHFLAWTLIPLKPWLRLFMEQCFVDLHGVVSSFIVDVAWLENIFLVQLVVNKHIGRTWETMLNYSNLGEWKDHNGWTTNFIAQKWRPWWVGSTLEFSIKSSKTEYTYHQFCMSFATVFR
jgi:hypothetical protein